MPKSYFAILELTTDATPDEVHSAYRRLAKAFHPDHYGGNSEPFQQIHEAYSVLGNPDKRKAYERSLPDRQVRSVPGITPSSEPEPLIPGSGPVDLGEISPIHSFETVSPSFDEIFDWLWDNSSRVKPKKFSRVHNLTLEVPITREQATRGGIATILVPAETICRTCRGYGHIGYFACHHCAGEGVISGEVPLSVAFPQGLMKDHSVVIPLNRFGIRNLFSRSNSVPGMWIDPEGRLDEPLGCRCHPPHQGSAVRHLNAASVSGGYVGGPLYLYNSTFGNGLARQKYGLLS